ncbi:MAG: CPXCG motif-containing cysteine-rich protein [Woeseiaceae bacterium]
MIYGLISRQIHCPYCAESQQIQLDLSAGSQEYIEDCQVCCQPILVRFAVDDGALESLETLCSN